MNLRISVGRIPATRALVPAVVALALAVPALALAQDAPQRRKVTAGPQYGGNGFHRADARVFLPGAVDDADRGRGAGPLHRGGRAHPRLPRGGPADEGPRPLGPGRPQLHLPRPRQGPDQHPPRGAAGHVRRAAGAGPDGVAAPGGGAGRRRDLAGGRRAHGARSAWSCSRTTPPSASSGRTSPASWARSRSTRRPSEPAPRLRGRGRDRGPHDALREARGEPGRARGRARVPARPALRRAHLRLRPPPQAVAVGEAGRGHPLAPDPRGPRPGVRAVRGPARARGRRLRPAAADLRAGVRPDPGPHLQRAGAGPLAAAGAAAGRVARGGRRR